MDDQPRQQQLRERARAAAIVRRYGNSDYGLGWSAEDVAREIEGDSVAACPKHHAAGYETCHCLPTPPEECAHLHLFANRSCANPDCSIYGLIPSERTCEWCAGAGCSHCEGIEERFQPNPDDWKLGPTQRPREGGQAERFKACRACGATPAACLVANGRCCSGCTHREERLSAFHNAVCVVEGGLCQCPDTEERLSERCPHGTDAWPMCAYCRPDEDTEDGLQT